jgi:hypothetical protein
MSEQHSIINKDFDGLRHNMLDGSPMLPTVGYMSAFGEVSVKFPIYKADPTPFLPDNLRAIKVRDLKDVMRPHTLICSSGDLQAIDIFKFEDLKGLVPADKAKKIVLMINEYKRRKIMPKVVRSLILQSANDPKIDVSRENDIMSLVGYIGHYLGDDKAEQFVDIMDYGVDESSLRYGKISSLISGAGASIAKSNEAILGVSSIHQEYHPTIEDQLTANALAVYEMGLDSKQTLIMAHYSTFESNTYKPEVKPDDYQSIRVKR